MRIFIDIGHPAHVHYFRNFIEIMESKGHDFLITARDKDVTFKLLDYYKIKYNSRGIGKAKLLGKIMYMFKADYIIYQKSREFNPDIFLSFGSPYASHASKLFGKPHIAFDDTEHAKLEHMMYVPFTPVVLTPNCFQKDFGNKHLRFNGYMELCYLHPSYFTPDPSVLDMLGVKNNEKYVILRFISWNASHDIGHFGLSIDMKKKAVKELSKYVKVFISSEEELPKDLKIFQINIPPEKIHDVLYYSSLYFGESGTMAVEAAILGIPSVRVSTIAKLLGNFQELSQKYELIHFFDKGTIGLRKAIELIVDPESKNKWQKKAQKLINDKIDVTQYMINFVEQYKNKG